MSSQLRDSDFNFSQLFCKNTDPDSQNFTSILAFCSELKSMYTNNTQICIGSNITKWEKKQQDPFIGCTPVECNQREGTSYKPLHMHLLVVRMKQSSLLLNHYIYTVSLFPVLTGEVNFKSYTLWTKTLTKGLNTQMKNLLYFKRTTK